MRVTMLEDRTVTVDGVNTIDAAAGETYNMGAGVAQSLVDAGAAEPADGENKDAGDAAETQAEKPKRSRKTKSNTEPFETGEPAQG